MKQLTSTMNPKEFKSLALRGSPIPNGFMKVRSLSLGEIFDYGETEFQRLLSLFFFDVGTIDFGDRVELQDIKKFVLFCIILQQEKDMRKQIQEGLRLFTGLDFDFIEGLFIYDDKYVIDEAVWENLKLILAFQNKIKYNPEELNYNPIGARAKAMQAKIEETRRQVQELKNKQNDIPSLSDLVSGLSAKHPSINLLNVWNLTYYQFVDQLERLQIVEEYEFALRSILAGADAKKLKIKHWTTTN